MKLFFSVVFLILISSLTFSQNDRTTVAQIDRNPITVNELKMRMELSPYVAENRYIYPDSIKYDFLYSLIAERLWSKEAQKLGYASSEKYKFFFQPIEDLFVRDALFKKEVEDKVRLSANDINSGIMKSQIKLSTQIVSSNDSASIYNFYHQIQSQNNFDSLLIAAPRITSKDLDIKFGTLFDEEIEDSLYSLNINQFTAPIKSEMGWVIFRIKNKTSVPIDLNDKKFIDDNKKIIKNRRLEKRYKEYTKELLSGTNIPIEPSAFKSLYYMIWDKLKGKTISNDNVKYYELSESDFGNILSSVSTIELNSKLFTIDKKSYSIKNFLSQLAFDGFSLQSLDSVAVLQKLKHRVKQCIESQLITEEGYNQQLNLTPQVREDLTRWNEKYLAQLYFNAVLDSINISDQEAYNYYLNDLVKNSNINLINVRLVNLKNLDEISIIIDSLKNGSQFADLVRSYGKTDSLVNENGETGLKPVLLLGDIGNIASTLKIDEVYGPIERNNSYTILQVFQKENSSDTLKLSFESVKNQLKNTLRFKALHNRLDKLTANLALKNNVKIYNNVLNQFEYSKVPMFVHRLMGFGGRIAGTPLVTPFSGWIKNMNRQKLFP
jgi:hypothetical protein